MAFDQAKCEGCPVDGMHSPMHPTGSETARFLVITDVPSMAGAKEKRLMSGGQVGVFAREMEEIGLERDDFRFYPMCRCAYNPNEHTNKTKTKIHKHCRTHMLDEIAELDPEAIIPLGAEASTQAFGKGTKITKVRGLGHDSEELGAPIFPLLSPGLVLRYPQNAPLFSADVQSLKRFIDSNYDGAQSNAPEHGNYQIVTDLQFLIDQDPEVISFDIESTGLRWYQQGCDVRTYKPEIHKGNPDFKPKLQILTMQFTVKEGESYMLVWDHPENPIPEKDKPRLRNQIRKLLCKPERIVVGQNVKIDNVFLWTKEGIRFRIGGDTLMLATMLDENMTEKNLDVLTKIHAPEMAGYADRFNATVNKARMWETPLSELRPYGCGDTDAAYRVYTKLEEELAQDDGLWNHYVHVALPGLNALAAMEVRGMMVDVDNELSKFQSFMKEEVERQYQSLVRQIPREIKLDHLNDPKMAKKTPEQVLSFSRGELVKDILFKHKKGFKLKPRVFTDSTKNLPPHMQEPSTSSKDHLPYFFDKCPFTVELAEYVKDKRLLDTSVTGFLNKYVVNNYVRPVYSLTKAVTGRTASEDPNGQNYPKRSKKAKAYRKMFKAPPGYFIAELDLSQAELRIAASLSGDPTMMQIYREGGDIHRATGAVVLGLTMEQFDALPKAEQKEARQKAKSVNFGFLYGMGWRNFIVFAKTQYGVEFTEAEAKRIRAGFFKKYPYLEVWHNKVREFAMRHKYVRSYTGRIRHLPMIDSSEEYIQQEACRQAINSPVQETGSSLGVMSLGRMNQDINSEYLQVVGFVHDAIVVYIKKEYLDWGLKTVKHYMQSNPLKQWFGTEIKVPIVADVGFGENLGDIIECEGFTLDGQFDYSSLKDKEGNLLVQVPKQKIPPNNGRLTRSPYTEDTDLENEEVAAVLRRISRTRPSVTRDAPAPAVKRISRTVAKPVEVAAPTVKRYSRTREPA